jgi:Ni/Fe-hydrogenase subunit HybB-like protein
LIFPWANSTILENDAEWLQRTKYYLNVWSFVPRAVCYFLVWIGFGFLLTRRQPTSVTEDDRRRLGMQSAFGLALFGITVTFASIDWAMSLEPEPKWFSTIYGVMFAVGMILSAFSFGVAIVCRFNPNAEKQVLSDLGNLLMAFTLVWVYMAFSQYLLIWSGNLREEITWYARRGQDVWSVMAFVLVLLQFAVPFVLLLSPTVKTNPRRLMAVAILVFAMRFVDLFWMVAPAFPNNSDLFWLQPVGFVGIGGLWLAGFLWFQPSVTPDPAPTLGALGELAHE